MMNTNFSACLTGPHLTNDEMDDVLIGCATAEQARHVTECAACGTQVRSFQSSVAVFNEGTMAWAQAKSNTVSRDLSAARISSAVRQPLGWSMGVATTAALAFVLAVNVHRSPDAAKAAAEQTASSTSDEEIASDNEMLQAIHMETRGTVAPAPLRPYHPNARIRHNAASEGQN